MTEKVASTPKRAKPQAVGPGNTSPGSSGSTTGQARKGGSKSTARPTRQGRKAPVSTTEEMKARIASRAYELYQSRGGHHGRDVDDWLEAETLVYLEQQEGRH